MGDRRCSGAVPQILNPAYSLPLSRYERGGHQIIIYGNPELTTEGHVNGEGTGRT